MQIPNQNILNPISNGFEQTKSTKTASKERRDRINKEISLLKEKLPLPSQTRQRLSQLQLMALVCVYVRKATYFQRTFENCLKEEMKISQLFKDYTYITKALSGFLVVMTQNGKLLYISDNAAEYLGHSMEDLLIQGDSVYDIIDPKDHAIIRETLETPKNANALNMEKREFFCRIIVNKNNRRQMRFGDSKLVLVSGHFYNYLPLSSSETPVFIAHCAPLVMPETRECVSQGNSVVYTSMHSADLKYLALDKNGESHLGYDLNTILNKSYSLYEFIHPQDLAEVSKKHIILSTPNSTEKSAILLIRLQNAIDPLQPYCWSHVVMQIKEPTENSQSQLVILVTVQVLTARESRVLLQSKWLYECYAAHARLPQFTSINNIQLNSSSTSSTSSENGSHSPNLNHMNRINRTKQNNSPLHQLVLNSNNTQPNSIKSIKRSRSCSNSPSNQYHPYQSIKNRLNSPDSQQLTVNATNLPSPQIASTISPDMSLMKQSSSKYNLTNLNNENSNSSTNLTSEAYLTANSQYNLNCLSPSDQQQQQQTNNHSLHHHLTLNQITPLNVNSETTSCLAQAVAVAHGQTPFHHTHNLLQQYSPQAGSLPTAYTSPFVNTSSANLFTHSPQHSTITNTTPPATPPEIANRSLNSNSSSHNGTLLNSINGTSNTTLSTSNKRSLNTSISNSLNSNSSSSSRSSPEPKRVYLGQNGTSFTNCNNGYAGFNHHYTYNINNYNSQTNNQLSQPTNLIINNTNLIVNNNSNKLQNHQLIQQTNHQATSFNLNQTANNSNNSSATATTQQQQYSFHHNRWLTTNNFTDFMPSVSNYYNAAALTQHQLNATTQQLLPNTVQSINQTYHPTYNPYSTNSHQLRTVAELS